MTSAPTPLELTGTVSLVEAENNTCTVTFNSDSEAREEVVVTGDIRVQPLWKEI